MSQFFESGGQRIGVSASASVLPVTTQDWFPLRLTGWTSLLSKGLSRVFSNTSVHLSSVTQVFLTLWDPKDCSMPGLPVHHQLLELTQTHVHQVSDAIQPSRPLLTPSPPAFNLSQHQGLFQWVSCLHQVAKVLGVSASASVLPMNIQDWFPLGLTGLIFQSKGLSKVFSNTTVQKHQFFSAQLSL